MPSLCTNNALIKTTVGAVSTSFGAMEFDASLLWWPMKAKVCDVGWGRYSRMLVSVLPPTSATHFDPFMSFGRGDQRIT